jgi:hypothetical protein
MRVLAAVLITPPGHKKSTGPKWKNFPEDPARKKFPTIPLSLKIFPGKNPGPLSLAQDFSDLVVKQPCPNISPGGKVHAVMHETLIRVATLHLS